MIKEELMRMLKDDLGVRKEIVALKAVTERPGDSAQYAGSSKTINHSRRS